MSIAELDDLQQQNIQPSIDDRPTTPPAAAAGPRARFTLTPQRRHTLIMVVAWVCVAITLGWFYIRPVYRAGIDGRQGFWVYWENNRFIGDIQNAMQQGSMVLREAEAVAAEDEKNLTADQRAARDKANAGQPAATIAKPGPGLFDRPWSPGIMMQRWHHLRPVYSQIYRGWFRTYERLQSEIPSGEYDLDYPPLRLMTMTLWTWKVQAAFPGLDQFPREPMRFDDPETKKAVYATPEIARPLLMLNTFCDGVSAVCVFFLVWIWVERRPLALKTWRLPQWRWGDARKSDVTLTPGLRYSEDPGLRGTSDTGVGIVSADSSWRSRWGDRILLLPVILLGIGLLIRPYVSFLLQNIPPAGDSLIDERVVSMGWWVFLVLRFAAVVALARFLPSPFRGVVCGAVAATLVWLNPASVLDSMGWPQWEVWLPPWFLLAALLVSVDWWLTAGLVLGVGCMFKGQLLFVAPLFILCPLFAGWLGRFMRVLAGLGIGMALVCWPWFVRNDSAKAYILGTVFAAGLICAVSRYRVPIWRQIVAAGRNVSMRVRGFDSGVASAPDAGAFYWELIVMIVSVAMMLSFRLEPPKLRVWLIGLGALGAMATWRQTLHYLPWIAVATASVFAAILVHQLRWTQLDYLHPWVTALTAAVVILPWFLPRRMIGAWMAFVFAASLWLGALSLNGSFSWWEVGFMYGTRKHDQMQLGGRSLSNLSSILQQRYRWDLHDPVATVQLSPKSAPMDLEMRQVMAIMFFITLVIIAAAAAVHLRRRDRRFLVALVAAWMCFVALLPQLAARYTLFPAIVAALLVAVSVPMSLFQMLLTTIACMMLGNQMFRFNPAIAPVSLQLTTPTHPDFGWTMVALALVLLFASMVQTPRGRELPLA